MIIGVSGYAQTGKSTTADILVRDFNYVEKSFAGPLKEALLKLDPYIDTNTRLASTVERYGWEFAKKYPECRALLQRMGTEVGREMWGQTFWVDQAMNSIAGMPRVAFSDVRFLTEASAIKDRGGIIIRVNRKGYSPVNSHPSEVELDDFAFDYVVENNGSINDLMKKIVKIMK